MLIDAILDRKAGYGVKSPYYKAKELYEYCMRYGGGVEGNIYTDVARALDSGTEQDVKNVLLRYIEDEYNTPEIRQYIKSVQWLKDDLDFEKRYSTLYDILGGEWQDVCLHPNELHSKLEEKGMSEQFQKAYQCAGTKMKLKKLAKLYLQQLGYECVPCEKIA